MKRLIVAALIITCAIVAIASSSFATCTMPNAEVIRIVQMPTLTYAYVRTSPMSGHLYFLVSTTIIANQGFITALNNAMSSGQSITILGNATTCPSTGGSGGYVTQIVVNP